MNAPEPGPPKTPNQAATSGEATMGTIPSRRGGRFNLASPPSLSRFSDMRRVSAGSFDFLTDRAAPAVTRCVNTRPEPEFRPIFGLCVGFGATTAIVWELLEYVTF